MPRRTTLSIILLLILIPTSYSISNAQTQTPDGSTKDTAFTAQLGNNNGTLVEVQQQVWYVFNSTPGVGYAVQLHIPSYLQAGVQVIDADNNVLFQSTSLGYSPTSENNTGFIGQGTVYFIIYDFSNRGDYSLTITTTLTGQTSFNPIEIGLGSTSLTINTAGQNKSYLHFNSTTADYLSFSLNVASSEVTVNTTIESSYHDYHQLYSSTSKEAIDFPNTNGAVSIILDYSATTIASFDITIILATKTAPTGMTPSNPYDLQLGIQKQINTSLGQEVFANMSISTAGWYNIDLKTLNAYSSIVSIVNETGNLIFTSTIFPINDYFKATPGEIMISVTLNHEKNINLTITRKNPYPGYDFSHALKIDSSHQVTFTPLSGHVYLNVTMNPQVDHILHINSAANTLAYIQIYAQNFVKPLYMQFVNNTIFLPRSYDFAAIVLNYEPNTVVHTVTLTDISDQQYSSLNNALSIDLNTLYSVPTNYSYQEVWTEFYASKGNFYQISTTTSPNINMRSTFYIYNDAGQLLSTGKQIIGGSNTNLYLRFVPPQSGNFVFKVEETTPTNPLTYDFYSSHLGIGDYLEYKSNTYVNGKSLNVPNNNYFSTGGMRIDMKQNYISLNQYEFLGNYLNMTFIDVKPDIIRWTFSSYQFSSLNSYLLPVSTSGDHEYDSRTILQQHYPPSYNITEDSQYYYLVQKSVNPLDFSYVTSRVTYDKTNLYLVSSSFVTINNSTGQIIESTTKLTNYKIQGPQSDRNSKTTSGDAPFKANFESVPFFIGLTVIPLIIRKTCKH